MRRSVIIAVLAVPAMGGLVACDSQTLSPVTTVPSPSPTPAPSPTPTSFTCRLPAGSNPTLNCAAVTPRFSDQLNRALDALMVRRPDLFNFEDLNGANPRVLNPTRYYLELQQELGRFGICTLIEAEEISIKSTNEFSEDWVVLTSGNYVRRRYMGTCTPAWW